jgi:hypothetical protein
VTAQCHVTLAEGRTGVRYPGCRATYETTPRRQSLATFLIISHSAIYTLHFGIVPHPTFENEDETMLPSAMQTQSRFSKSFMIAVESEELKQHLSRVLTAW